MNQYLKVGLIITVGIVAMSSASIFVRLAQRDGVPSLVIAAYRLSLATVVLSIPAASQRVWTDYAKLDRLTLGLLVVSGALLGMHFATWISSLAQTSVLSSVVLVSSTPVWIGLASPIVLKEQTSGLTWTGIAIALFGSLVIGLVDLGSSVIQARWGDLLALLGAMFAAAYLMIGRSVRSRLPLTAYVWVVYGTAALLLLGWVWVAGLPVTGYQPRAYLWLVMLALIPQLIGHTAANYSVRHLPATLVGISTLGEPIGSTVLALIVLDQIPQRLQLIGGILILIGIALASMLKEPRAAPQYEA